MKRYDLSKLKGDIVKRDDRRYEEGRKSWNRAIDKYPLAIVYCNSKEEIASAVIWARENNVNFRIRSGGHNYEGFSTGDDVIVIDISKLNGILIDEKKGIVKIDGGVRNREAYEALGSKGYPFPGGGCPTVGVSGLVLGGGWGYSSRLLGLSCDSLIEIELVNYDGQIVIANNESNKELFWACRGAGGGNFGVVTAMTFSLPNKVEMATLINVDYKNCKLEEAIDILTIWQKIFDTLDRRFNGKMSVYNSKENGKGVKFTALFYGNEEEANIILEPLKSKTEKMIWNIEYIKVLEANRKIMDSHADYETYKSSGRFVYGYYNKEELKTIIKLIDDRARGSIYTAITFYGLGGAILDRKKDSTAFYYRDAKFVMGFQSLWEEANYADDNNSWFLEKFKYIKVITKGSFVNFPLLELENYNEEYFGKNVMKLYETKKKYDPLNVFRFKQGIYSESGKS